MRLTGTCQDFDVTFARWEKEGTPHERRMTEFTAYCPHHFVGFTGYHVGYYENGTPSPERMYECSYCGCQFPYSSSMECDSR